MGVFGKIIREPSLYFLMIGGGLFLLFNVMNGGTIEKPNQIVISQGQVELLAANFTRTWQRSPSGEEMQLLIDDYLFEEVYYREALALGLDKDDIVIRRRLRQKLGFIFEDTTSLLDPNDKELSAYMNIHADQFRLRPQVSFRHIYLSRDTRSDIDADARTLLTSLQAGEDPKKLGDQIMIADSFTLASQDDINRRFGESFANQLLTVKPGEWSGPLTSGFGSHLVLITEIKPGRMPELEAVKDKVKSEWLLPRTAKLKQDTYRKLLENYEVVMPKPVAPSDVRSSDPSPTNNAVGS